MSESKKHRASKDLALMAAVQDLHYAIAAIDAAYMDKARQSATSDDNDESFAETIILEASDFLSCDGESAVIDLRDHIREGAYNEE